MSRQLTRIRSLISEIDEIQKQGQAKARIVAPPAGLSAAAEIIPLTVDSPAQAASAEPGRIALSLSENVILEIQCGETVEIKKAAQGLEIVFQDGKAFHIPFKDVA